MKIATNIRFADEARLWLLRHYMDPDTDDPSRLSYIPVLSYSLETRDSAGNKIAGPRHSLSRRGPDTITREVVSPFDNGRKFVAIVFHPEEHDDKATYLIEYLDGVWYVLKG